MKNKNNKEHSNKRGRTIFSRIYRRKTDEQLQREWEKEYREYTDRRFKNVR